MRVVWNLLASALLLTGALCLARPFYNAYRYEQTCAQAISDFHERQQEAEQSAGSAQTDEYEALYERMKSYNETIFLRKQRTLGDAFDGENASSAANAFADEDAVGCIRIPAMDIELPLYIGATKANMAKGAAVVEETSLPIGGMNTNCVIAAHRGYRGIPMFREIEVLVPGDVVIISNLREELHYTVVKCIVTNPYDSDAIRIFEGQDMVTLVTCHPYTKNTHRYLVYCVRDESGYASEASSSQTGASASLLGALPDGVEFAPSSGAIHIEQRLLCAGLVLLAGLFAAALAVLVVYILRKHKKS